MVEHPLEVEVPAELASGEAVELVAHGAAAEEIRGAPFEAGARAAEGEVASMIEWTIRGSPGR